MKLKEETKKEGMPQELYNLFIKLIQAECDKLSFIMGAKAYCWTHGLQNDFEFFHEMYSQCTVFKATLVWHLLTMFEEVPEFKTEAIKTDYDSEEALFVEFAKREDEFVSILEETVITAKNTDSVDSLAFLLPIVKNIDHIACRALEAVRNDKNPKDLLCNSYCAYNTTC